MTLFLIFHKEQPVIAMSNHKQQTASGLLDSYARFSGFDRSDLTWGAVHVLDTKEIMNG